MSEIDGSKADSLCEAVTRRAIKDVQLYTNYASQSDEERQTFKQAVYNLVAVLHEMSPHLLEDALFENSANVLFTIFSVKREKIDNQPFPTGLNN